MVGSRVDDAANSPKRFAIHSHLTGGA